MRICCYFTQPQMWNTGNEEEQSRCAYSSFGRPASRLVTSLPFTMIACVISAPINSPFRATAQCPELGDAGSWLFLFVCYKTTIWLMPSVFCDPKMGSAY